ncbi:MAG: hypothetical protein K2N35_12535 [Muribaculaceae bacterium]|nr:hypothetical protein [Muribaculaceae bacterium]
MKQKRLLFTAIGLIAVVLANATSWRINPDPKAKAQFKTVAEAMEDSKVVEGDTLLLDPGSHGDFNLTKDNITLIGPGYFLDQKEGWSETDQAFVGTVRISTHSTIEGCTASLINLSNYATARRCNVKNIGCREQWTGSRYHSCVVEQCFVTGNIWIFSYSKIKNNIVLGTVGVISVADGNPQADGIIIENNTIINQEDNDSYCVSFQEHPSNSIVRNNIILNLGTNKDNSVYDYTGPKLSIYNNVTNSKTTQEYVNDKVIDATIESLFINEGSMDGRWQLRANSPAKGASANGEDCGAFGGSNHYVLAGLPRLIPHITKVEVPARPTNGKLNIKIKIENQDE